MESQGYPVTRIDVPKPGKHPHATQMATLLFLLEAFGLVALLLSAVLVVNMISALLSQQIRQIGVMKAIGANNRQVISIYYGMVLILGMFGLMIGLPLALLAGRTYASFAARCLISIYSVMPFHIRTSCFRFSLVFLFPLLAASFPILRSGRISVREAISDYGIPQESNNQNWLTRVFTKSIQPSICAFSAKYLPQTWTVDFDTGDSGPGGSRIHHSNERISFHELLGRLKI